MKTLLFAIFFSFRIFAQTYDADGIVAQGFATPEHAVSAIPNVAFYPSLYERTSIIPLRMAPSYNPHIGLYDKVTYVVVRQALINPATYTCPYAASVAEMPLTDYSSCTPEFYCTGWHLTEYLIKQDLTSEQDAVIFYNSLTSQQKATAYILSTPSNVRWLVVYQKQVYFVSTP